MRIGKPYIDARFSASANTRSVVPLSPPFNHKIRFCSDSHVGSLAFKSLLSNFDCLVLISSTRISEDFECDWNEYVETVKSASVPD